MVINIDNMHCIHKKTRVLHAGYFHAFWLYLDYFPCIGLLLEKGHIAKRNTVFFLFFSLLCVKYIKL